MKKILCIIAAVALLLAFTACGISGTDPDAAGSSVLPEASSGKAPIGKGNQAAISLDKFKSEITRQQLGKVIEVDGDYGYDAALVTAEDGTNYIYMYLADPDMAKVILTDSDADGEMDSDFSLTTKGNGYELYTQESTESDSAYSAIYGRCLLAGSMILIVSGTIENKEQVRKNADTFMKELGYDL